MTPHGLVTPATAADAYELEPRLRPEDRRELEDISGRSALQLLLLGVLASAPALTLRTHDGALIGLLGVVPDGATGRGVVWMAGTSVMERRSVPFLRGCRDVLAVLHETYDTLFNVCDARNTVHHKWLEWMGFSFIRKIDRHGPNGVPVIEFARIA